MSIYQTKDLTKFRYHPRNRNVNRSAVKKLAASILRIGLKNPIVVTNNFVVLDGQHRLEAIKLINETSEWPHRISFIKKNLKMSDIAEMNSNQLQWRMTDWIHFHALGGNKNYVQLQEVTAKYSPLKMTALAAYLHKDRTTETHTSVINAGRFVYTMTPTKKYILDKLQALCRINGMYGNKSVLVAIMWLSRDANFDSQRLFHAIELNFESIMKQSGTGNWARHFARWYNKGLRYGKLNIDDLPSHH